MSAAPATATVPAAAKPQTLDELMLAMDVVDTIRYRELIVERELGQGARDEELRNRLREIYKSQGIEVTDRVIDEGIKALKESRFVYTPPPPSLGRSLALVWINRGRIVGTTLAVLVGASVLWAGYEYGIVAPRERVAEAARVDLAETLPKALQTAYDGTIAEAKVEPARTRAAGILSDGRNALARSDAAAARTAVADLGALRAELVQTYRLRITGGAWRYPADNTAARNHYLIVEAVAPGGRKLTMPIRNEEDNRTYNVDQWGVRVPQSIYDAVGRDKGDNGIIDDDVLGEKARGELDPRYRMTVLGGTITSWDDD